MLKLIIEKESQIKEFSDKLTDEDKTSLNESLDKLKEAHKMRDLLKIDETMGNLNEVWNKISTKLYQDQSTSSSEPNSEEKVEDASFEEVK